MKLARLILGWTVLVAFGVDVVCVVAYNAIGQRVDADGTLVEPFFLIPVGWLFFFAGFLAVFAYAAVAVAQRLSRPAA